MADFFGLNLIWLIVKMMVNHQLDGWTWQVITCSPTAGWRQADLQIVCSDAEEMPANDFISFKYQTVFLSLLRPVLCAFERQPIKNPKAFGTLFVFTKQCSSPSTLDTAHSMPMEPPLPPMQCPALCSHAWFSVPDTFLHTIQKTAFQRVAKQILHDQQQKISPSLFGLFFFFPLKFVETNNLVDSSSPSFRNTDVRNISNVSYTPA